MPRGEVSPGQDAASPAASGPRDEMPVLLSTGSFNSDGLSQKSLHLLSLCRVNSTLFYLLPCGVYMYSFPCIAF